MRPETFMTRPRFFRWLHGSEKAINPEVTVGNTLRPIRYNTGRFCQPAPSVSANFANSQKIFSGHPSDHLVNGRSTGNSMTSRRKNRTLPALPKAIKSF